MKESFSHIQNLPLNEGNFLIFVSSIRHVQKIEPYFKMFVFSFFKSPCENQTAYLYFYEL